MRIPEQLDLVQVGGARLLDAGREGLPPVVTLPPASHPTPTRAAAEVGSWVTESLRAARSAQARQDAATSTARAARPS